MCGSLLLVTSLREAALTKAQTIALYLIVLLLMADFAIKHVQPTVVLKLNEQAYLAAARQCHEALSNRQELLDASIRLDRETAFALNRSAVVGLMECYEKETLRRSLLAWGVDEQDLNRIDLVARAESKAGLRHFVQGVTGEK